MHLSDTDEHILGRTLLPILQLPISYSTAYLLVSSDGKFLQPDILCLLTALLVLFVLHQYEAKSRAQDVDNHACIHI